MDLTSPTFFVFLAIFLSFYYLFPSKLRSVALIIGSGLFILSLDYGLLFYLLVFILLNYLFTYFLTRISPALLKKIILGLSVGVNIFSLAYFKYFSFFTNNLSSPLSFILPIGMSFFVFKNISFLIDTYKQPSVKTSLSYYFSYILFFPEFLSGPIDRFSNFSHSLQNQTRFSSDIFFNGTYRFLLGLFKKLIIANNLALLINPIYNNPSLFKSSSLLICTFLFSFQIFFDFSGYSDMAIGIGKMLGFSIPENFNRPYFANSIKEFWRRWHITLSSWFRDYLYIPLGGNRKGLSRQIINILIVFLITGLWHGASWNFIFWGLIHGFYQVISLVFPPIPSLKKLNPKMKNLINIFITFNLINFAWIFFRAKSLKQAVSFVSLIFKLKPNLISPNFLIISIPLILTLILYFLIYLSQTRHHPIFIKTVISVFIILSLLFFSPSQPQDFLYFKF